MERRKDFEGSRKSRLWVEGKKANESWILSKIYSGKRPYCNPTLVNGHKCAKASERIVSKELDKLCS